MKRINPPQRFKNLKDERYWSLEFAQDTHPNDDFTFHLLRKVGEGSYEHHGWTTEPGEAFQLRRELIQETGITNYFIRARKVTKTYAYAEPDGDATLDYFRDKHNEGVGLEDIPRHLRADYLSYQRGRRTAK